MQEEESSISGLAIFLGKKIATDSSILDWEIPWTEDPVGLSPWGHKWVGDNRVTKQKQHIHVYIFANLPSLRSTRLCVKYLNWKHRALNITQNIQPKHTFCERFYCRMKQFSWVLESHGWFFLQCGWEDDMELFVIFRLKYCFFFPPINWMIFPSPRVNLWEKQKEK